MPEETHQLVAEDVTTNETSVIFAGSLELCEERLADIGDEAWSGSHSNFRVEEV
jgi:hypothetical protein